MSSRPRPACSGSTACTARWVRLRLVASRLGARWPHAHTWLQQTDCSYWLSVYVGGVGWWWAWVGGGACGPALRRCTGGSSAGVRPWIRRHQHSRAQHSTAQHRSVALWGVHLRPAHPRFVGDAQPHATNKPRPATTGDVRQKRSGEAVTAPPGRVHWQRTGAQQGQGRCRYEACEATDRKGRGWPEAIKPGVCGVGSREEAPAAGSGGNPWQCSPVPAPRALRSKQKEGQAAELHHHQRRLRNERAGVTRCQV